MFDVNKRRQVVSQDVLAKAEIGTLKPQDTKNLKHLTKTIIDRFFDAPSPPHVKVCFTFVVVRHREAAESSQLCVMKLVFMVILSIFFH